MTFLKQIRGAVALVGVGAAVAGLVGSAKANVIAEYQANADPTTEGFTTVINFGGSSTTGPIANDLGLPAWSIVGSTQSSQYAYGTSAVTAAQQAQIATNGFTLTMVARAIENIAPVWSASSQIAVAGANLIFGGLRWEIDLGIDANGDTVVILPNTLNNNGPGGSILEFGPSHVLTGSDDTYNTFQLVYNPISNLANLFVNGTEEITGYTGNTSFVENWGLAFYAVSGGRGNFNLVEVTSGASPSVPEPSSLAIFLSALIGLIGMTWWATKFPRISPILENGARGRVARQPGFRAG